MCQQDGCIWKDASDVPLKSMKGSKCTLLMRILQIRDFKGYIKLSTILWQMWLSVSIMHQSNHSTTSINCLNLSLSCTCCMVQSKSWQNTWLTGSLNVTKVVRDTAVTELNMSDPTIYKPKASVFLGRHGKVVQASETPQWWRHKTKRRFISLWCSTSIFQDSPQLHFD